MTNPLLTDFHESPGMTFAEPLASDRFVDIFAAAEKQQRLVNNAFAADQSREQVYDQRIAAIKTATGVELENPERGGYSLTERDLRRLTVDGPIDPMEYRRAQFEQRLTQLRTAHPDKAEALAFSDINEAAKGVAKTAEVEGARETGANPIKSITAELAGGIWGSRRDPLFVGSMFFGPTSAAGKTAFTRIASSSIFQGLFNAGVTAVEQPAVQQWREEIGVRSGAIPAMENVGMAFLFGAIPGAVIQGGKEALAGPLRRVMEGRPQAGDLDALHAGLSPAAPREAAALASGAESVAADRATLTIPEPKGIAPEVHNDMMAAALKRGDNLAEPSPEAVQAVREMETKVPEGPAVSEIEQRVAEAQPRSEREALIAADEALDDIGRRESMAVVRESVEAVRAEQDAARVARAEAVAAAPEPPPKIPAKDPIGKVPWLDDSGNPKLLSPKAAAAIGERDDLLAMLVRSCK